MTHTPTSAVPSPHAAWWPTLRSPLWLGVWPAVFIAAMAVLPMLKLMWFGVHNTAGYDGNVQGSFWLGWLGVWGDDYLRARMVWSITQAVVSTVLACLLGVPVAYVLARRNFAGRTMLLRLLMLPFVVPTLVAAMGVLAWWGPHGVVGRYWYTPGSDADSPWLLIAGNLFFNLCVMVRAATYGFAAQSATRLAVARSLGATPWRAFWRIELPNAAPHIYSAACLVLLYCLGGFGLALLLGGQAYATAEVVIYTLVAHELELVLASQLALWMLAMTGVLVAVYAKLHMRASQPRLALLVARRNTRWHSAADVAMLVWVWGVCLLVGFAPLLAIVLKAALAPAQAWAVLWQADTWQAVTNTLRFSAAALVVATVLGVLHAACGARLWWWRMWGMLPLMISPIMVAFGLLLLVPQWLDQWGLLVAAYALLAIPLVSQPVASALAGLPTSWVQAARSLGATPARAWWRVTWPLVLPAVRRGMAFAMASMLGEFAVSLFLNRPEWTTLTTFIYQHLGRPGSLQLDRAWVLSALLLGLTAAVFVLIEPPQSSRANEPSGADRA